MHHKQMCLQRESRITEEGPPKEKEVIKCNLIYGCLGCKTKTINYTNIYIENNVRGEKNKQSSALYKWNKINPTIHYSVGRLSFQWE